MTETCPCGSHRAYDDCCAPLHRGRTSAPTAEALMRSRYSAYVLGLADYLLGTWAAATRPDALSLDEAASCWIGLEIRATRAGGETDAQGEVEFVARAISGEHLHRLHEVSRFCREEGGWRYLDGALAPDTPVKLGRNLPCPCGSGRKFKRCHGA
jgi:SEC-C motif-containing protein